MKVSELAGSALDYWVARANGWTFGPPHKIHGWDVWRDSAGEMVGVMPVSGYTPSTDWATGGPIIERELIELRHFNDGWCANIKYQNSHWYGTVYQTIGSGERINTPLVAAMRAYVASKYGDTVPDEPTAS